MISSSSARSARSTAGACSGSRPGPHSSPWRRPTALRDCGTRMTDQQIAAGEMPVITHAFFDRARARLNLEVPPGLTDPSAPAMRGDLDLDPAMWERAGVKATRPAAVLIPVVDRPEPGVIL